MNKHELSSSSQNDEIDANLDLNTEAQEESWLAEKDAEYFKKNPQKIGRVVYHLINLRGENSIEENATWDKEQRAYVGEDGMPRDYAHLTGFLKKEENANHIDTVLEEFKDLRSLKMQEGITKDATAENAETTAVDYADNTFMSEERLPREARNEDLSSFTRDDTEKQAEAKTEETETEEEKKAKRKERYDYCIANVEILKELGYSGFKDIKKMSDDEYAAMTEKVADFKKDNPEKAKEQDRINSIVAVLEGYRESEKAAEKATEAKTEEKTEAITTESEEKTAETTRQIEQNENMPKTIDELIDAAVEIQPSSNPGSKEVSSLEQIRDKLLNESNSVVQNYNHYHHSQADFQREQKWLQKEEENLKECKKKFAFPFTLSWTVKRNEKKRLERSVAFKKKELARLSDRLAQEHQALPKAESLSQEDIALIDKFDAIDARLREARERDYALEKMRDNKRLQSYITQQEKMLKLTMKERGLSGSTDQQINAKIDEWKAEIAKNNQTINAIKEKYPGYDYGDSQPQTNAQQQATERKAA